VAFAPEITSIPLKTTRTYKVKRRFFEGSFAYNVARLGKLKSIMAANPRAQLLTVDERGSVLVDADVKFAGMEVPEEWGQYRREVTVSFECFANLRTGGLNASFTPDGALATPLPNVAHWEGGMQYWRQRGDHPEGGIVLDVEGDKHFEPGRDPRGGVLHRHDHAQGRRQAHGPIPIVQAACSAAFSSPQSPHGLIPQGRCHIHSSPMTPRYGTGYNPTVQSSPKRESTGKSLPFRHSGAMGSRPSKNE
jgi:hypothetical protein